MADVQSTTETALLIMNAAILPLLGWALGKINSIARESRDLWEWHKPDGSGKQNWKNPEFEKHLQALVTETRGLRQDMRENHNE